MTIAEITSAITRIAPPAAGEPSDPAVLESLSNLTADLADAYRRTGLLTGDPFGETRQRSIHLHETAVRGLLAGQVILVTGGSGCVGRALIRRLAGLGVRRIVSLDRTAPASAPVGADFSFECCDLTDREGVLAVMHRIRPFAVFHLGAQRNPGLAERAIRDTLNSNVTGTAHVIEGCLASGVAHCVFSSTGKASRYFTGEIYAASKKLAEWQIVEASFEKQTSFSAVRFTHMLDNSLACEQIDAKIAGAQPVNVHAPQRYVIAQSRIEAVSLLLNSLLFSSPGLPRISVVRNLGWPVETLEYALHRIQESGRRLPIYFQGLPGGYEESFFAGQVSWDVISEVHPLLNALEDGTRTTDSSGETLHFAPALVEADPLHDGVAEVIQAAADPGATDMDMRKTNARCVRKIASTSMDAAPLSRVLQILRWGTDPRRLNRTGDTVEHHREMIRFLGESIAPRRDPVLEMHAGFAPGEMESLLTVADLAGADNSFERFAMRTTC